MPVTGMQRAYLRQKQVLLASLAVQAHLCEAQHGIGIAVPRVLQLFHVPLPLLEMDDVTQGYAARLPLTPATGRREVRDLWRIDEWATAERVASTAPSENELTMVTEHGLNVDVSIGVQLQGQVQTGALSIGVSCSAGRCN